MAEIAETVWSRQTRLSASPTATLEFFIFGAGDELNAEQELRAYLGRENLITYRQLAIQSIQLRATGYTHQGRWYTATVEYGPGAGINAGGPGGSGPKFTVKFGGQSTRILQGMKPAVSYTKSGDPKIDFGAAINVSHDGVAGVEVPKPTFEFALTIIIPTVMFNPQYQVQIARRAWTSNDRPWRGFAVDEVVFTGLDGAGELGGETSLTFGFSVTPHATGLKVGEIENITKPGQHYLWVYYEQTVDNTGKVLKQWPRQVDVLPVWPQSDFSGLGVGN